MDRKAYLEQFSEDRIKESRACDLASRIRVEIDAEMDAVYPQLYAGKVTIVTKAGKRHTKRVAYSKGMPENPRGGAELEDKFHIAGRLGHRPALSTASARIARDRL
ncbi:MAG: MmgE/PrpD family protein [Betaproteobacteria bacterium]|nr:MmgE/PrpD family protein [Betaproteobacteria bacterium]